MKLDKIFPSTQTDAEVSSQEDSIASMVVKVYKVCLVNKAVKVNHDLLLYL